MLIPTKIWELNNSFTLSMPLLHCQLKSAIRKLNIKSLPKECFSFLLLNKQVTPVKMIERSVYSGYYCFEHNLCKRYALTF